MEKLTEKELKELIEIKKKEKKKNRFSKFIVSFIVLLNVLFTTGVLYVFLRTGNEPMTLVGAWFAFTTGELWMLSSIKKTKVNGGNQEHEYRDYN